ncbi:PAS domain S-box protein [Thermodesulfobacteriota bacterium]
MSEKTGKPEYADLEKKISGLEREIADLRKHENKPSTLFQCIKHSPNMIVITDPEGLAEFVNFQFTKTTGFTESEILGKKIALFGLQSPDNEKRFFDQIKSGKVLRGELVNRRKDGTLYREYVSVSAVKDYNGTVAHIVRSSEDVSTGDKGEETNYERRRRYSAIIEAMPEGYFEVDLKGNFTFVNEIMVKLHKRSREELIGLNYREYTPQENQKRIFKIYNDVYNTGSPAIIPDYEIIRKDGSRGIFEVFVILIKDISGESIGFQCISRDITDRKKTETALQESEKRYRNILETMEEGYYEVDLNGTYTFANKAACRIHKRTYDELIGLNNRAFSDPETAKRIYKIYNEIYKTGVPAKIFDYPIIRSDGEVVILETSGSLMRNAEGTPIGFHGLSRDVTERKKAEKALRESEEKYRSILETMEEGYYEVDLKGIYTFVNESECRIHKRTYEEIIGFNYRDFSDPEAAQRGFKIYNTIYKTGVPSKIFDYQIIRSDGEVITVETSGSLMRNAEGTPIGFRGISRDVTERKKAEEALRENEEKYRLLVENANDGIYITQDGIIKFPNPKVIEFTGYSEEELASMKFLDLIHPEDKETIAARQQQKDVEKDLLSNIYSFKLINREKNSIWVELNTVPIAWEGRPATLNFLRDITPQKKMEAQLLQAKKMEAMGTLAGGIAHDFNNLLMGIQGNASLVLLDIDSDHPHHDKLRSIEQLIRDGSELTKQLLGVARGGKYEVKPTDLNKLIMMTSDLFGRTKKEIAIHKELDDNIWTVEVDRSQIQQVLLNIYVNAWHAMKEGGDLYIETRNVILDEDYSRPYDVSPGKFVKISVTDTGIGMDETTLKRVFDPFFTTKKMGRGTGLGLASAYGIIRNHNGIINAYSEEGEGTTFNLYLPVSKKEIEKETDLVEEIVMGDETILFVDDEAPIIEIGYKLLKRMGYSVVTARDGEKAIEIFKEKQGEIDLVILDMIMPGIGGGGTFDRLKEIDPHVKVLLSSGYSMNGQAKTIIDRGCEGFIQKPFSPGTLSRIIREILDQ